MPLNVALEMERLNGMAVRELRAKHLEVFGEESRSNHREHLVRRIMWRMQAKEYGGISERALARAAELADDAALRVSTPKTLPTVSSQSVTRQFTHAESPGPLPGSVITREYKGRMVRVMVLDDGFEFAGERYKSLTAVAKAVTGAHWNGNHFFGVSKGKARA